MRSNESHQDIIDSVINGNRKQAAEFCVDRGLYARDLLDIYREPGLSDPIKDLVLLVEMVSELRAEQEMEPMRERLKMYNL